MNSRLLHKSAPLSRWQANVRTRYDAWQRPDHRRWARSEVIDSETGVQGDAEKAWAEKGRQAAYDSAVKQLVLLHPACVKCGLTRISRRTGGSAHCAKINKPEAQAKESAFSFANIRKREAGGKARAAGAQLTRGRN